MLAELRVRDLGVIADLHLVLSAGMTALTGETGAGKTLVVDAIELLVGGRAEPGMVRAGADEAVVEGRFVAGDDEVVVRRVIPRTGRSRAYLDGAMATAAELADRGATLVDLHGQHAHQSLLSGSAQRAALDAFGAIDLTPLHDARQARDDIAAKLEDLGGDPHQRAREVDLLGFQVAEIAAANLRDPDEEAGLETHEDALANAVAHREAAAAAYAVLADEGAAADGIRAALAGLLGREPFAGIAAQLQAALAELDDAAATLRDAAEAIEEDPEALAAVRSRRQLLIELRRKYGDTLEDVMRYGDEAAEELARLRSHDDEVERLTAALAKADTALARAATAVRLARAAAAGPAAVAVQDRLRALALPRATLSIVVAGEGAGDDVQFLFAANPGENEQPLRKVASGGELARVMLALRLVLTSGPPTMVFDEVDAGIGGEAAVAVGQALAGIGDDRQVLVVTHLPQVAAFADAQVQVVKEEADDRVVAQAVRLTDTDRVVELSRMLAGDADSAAARKHAKELLAAGRRRRGE
ncbi:MAG: DNA repair protein RecN [Acidimicrobiales bacterium]|nr:DNA repair protein RecN [Acidimicrobiales bacterium]